MNRTEATPFLEELRDTAGTALARLDELEEAAARWIQRSAQITIDPPGDEDDLDLEALRLQAVVFNSLEAFLAAVARLSLILWPARQAGQTRARALKRRLGFRSTSPVANRDLRNFWMHFDEHLDRAIAGSPVPKLQVFTTSTSVTPALKRDTLRLFELDTLVIHFPGSSQRRRRCKLRSLRPDLRRLRQATKARYKFSK